MKGYDRYRISADGGVTWTTQYADWWSPWVAALTRKPKHWQNG